VLRSRQLRSAFGIGLATLIGAGMLTGCGGSSSSSSSDPGSASYDPATTTLQKAGLEACSEAQQDVPPTLSALPGLGLTRAFYVAKDCMGAKVTPNAMIVFQFTNVDDFNSGTQSVKAKLPKASVLPHYPLVIAATGPDREANLAAVEKQLPPTTVTTTAN
jgi:hypothetical protein